MKREALNAVRVFACVLFNVYAVVFAWDVPWGVSFNDTRLTNSIVMMCAGFIILGTFETKKEEKTKP